MKTRYYFLPVILLAIYTLLSFKTPIPQKSAPVLYKNFTLIDGNGGTPVVGTDMLVENGRITKLGKNLKAAGATVIDLQGKTIIPALTSAHVHIGTLKGNVTNAENYTKENIIRQLKKYADYGVLNVLSMGTDRPVLFENNFYDEAKKGIPGGARMLSAGYGFGVHNGAPPFGPGMDMIYRPSTVEEVEDHVAELSELKVAAIKIWVDDFGSKIPKMEPAIYKKIISEAHKYDIKVVSHAYYLSDARRLVADGIDVIGHSIRDSLMDDNLLKQMKLKNVVYIPTLTLDKYSYAYAGSPEWIDDDFFKKSLEPGVLDMLTSAKYKTDQKNSPSYKRNNHAFETALKNLKKVYDAGILVALGTDSGANPVRTQGFSEHLELELMVQAGLTPLQALTVATKNASKALKLDKDLGTLQTGKSADFIVLGADPSLDIKNTRKIEGVYRGGERIDAGK